MLMADIWSLKKRSEVMAKIRKTNSSPERTLRTYLRHAGIRYSTYGTLPGTPDIIIKDWKLAVFVHGCFWHGCSRHYRSPHTNVEYWSTKLRKNRARDKAIARRIRLIGWHQAVIWECQVKRNPRQVVERLMMRHEMENGCALSRDIL